MFTALDHIIIGVNDLEQAAITFTQKLGLSVSGGGIHPSGGTANRIIVIGDTYLELIAVRTPAEAQQSMIKRLAKGDGYLNFVLASNDIMTDAAAMVACGTTIIGPNPGELRSSGGRSRAWTRADIERRDLTQHYPFLIEHDSTGEERRFRLAGWTTPPDHPLGATKILSTTIAVENLAEATQRFQQIYGLQPSAPFSENTWDASLVSFPLGDGTQHFELAMPTNTNVGESTRCLLEPGALADHLQQFGESLCRMTVVTESLAASRRHLDAHKVMYSYGEKPDPTLWIHPHETCGAVIVLREA